ncbi:hypothetical protein U8527_09820 [Kordia algicida OT-1]|uniref:Yip1 domain-containing protein n=1 Tax=Kordia algicida OT-1 TaxID=391587 RepID=A9DVB0_9FLAO|nr:hypothetical protein [Kordia algicida]EDP96397.1 hypothetical protein KAOT1_03272 [Kordia algicida OT-1]
MKLNTSIYFVLLAFFVLCFGIISQGVLGTETLLMNSLADIYTQEQLEETLAFQDKWQWVGYVAVPLLLLIKISVIALILDIGMFFFDKKIKYKQIFRAVVKAEFIFLLVIVVKTVWLYFLVPNYTLEDVQYFYPLSALSVVGYKGMEAWFVYPLQTFNVFEIAYWCLLAFFIGKQLKENIGKSFTIVASSYGVALVIWIIGVVFLTLHLS